MQSAPPPPHSIRPFVLKRHLVDTTRLVSENLRPLIGRRGVSKRHQERGGSVGTCHIAHVKLKHYKIRMELWNLNKGCQRRRLHTTAIPP